MKSPLSDVSFRTLETFCAVEETGSITVAAAQMKASRSAVSQQITNLERLLGVRLVDRTSRPVTLTPSGEILLSHARQLLRIKDQAEQELADMPLTALIQLRLGIIDDLDASVTPDLVMHLKTRLPRCRIEVNSGRSDTVTGQLEDRNIDLALTSLLPGDADAFSTIQILREPYVLVASKGVLDKESDLLGQITQLPFIRYNVSMPMGAAIARHLQRLKVSLSADYAFDASRSVFAMVLKSGGWTMTTPLCLLDARAELEALECFALPFPALSRTIHAVARTGELGQLPEYVATQAAKLIRDTVQPKLQAIAPWIGEEFVVSGERKQDVSLSA